ncbi:MAG: hypothetical protein IRF12RH_04305 [Rickettsia helvetica]|uniref:Uncharacterized protein n=1 Tax=Rickettsia helvetica TaxID=35789 RepID=A0ABM9NCF3_RICHE
MHWGDIEEIAEQLEEHCSGQYNEKKNHYQN